MYYCLKSPTVGIASNPTDARLAGETSSRPDNVAPSSTTARQHSDQDEDMIHGFGRRSRSRDLIDKGEVIAKILIDICKGKEEDRSPDDYLNHVPNTPFDATIFRTLSAEYDFKDYTDNDSGCSLIHHALNARHQEIFDLLLDIGANINVLNKNLQNTPLHIACLLPSPLPWITKLILHGAHVDILNRRHQTPLHVLLCNPQISSSRQLMRCIDLLLLIRDQDDSSYVPEPELSSPKGDGHLNQKLNSYDDNLQMPVLTESNFTIGNTIYMQNQNLDPAKLQNIKIRESKVNFGDHKQFASVKTDSSPNDIPQQQFSILRKSLSPPSDSDEGNYLPERDYESDYDIRIRSSSPLNDLTRSPTKPKMYGNYPSRCLRTKILNTKDIYARLTPLLCAKFALFRRDFSSAYAIARKVLPLGACPNEQDKDGRTLLSYSVTYLDDSINLTRLLINYGACVYVTNLIFIPTEGSRNNGRGAKGLVKEVGHAETYPHTSKYHLRMGYHLLGANDKLFCKNFYPLNFEVEDGCRSQLVFGEFKIWKEYDAVAKMVSPSLISPYASSARSCRFQASAYDGGKHLLSQQLSKKPLFSDPSFLTRHHKPMDRRPFKRKHTVTKNWDRGNVANDMYGCGVVDLNSDRKIGCHYTGKSRILDSHTNGIEAERTSRDNEGRERSCDVRYYREICGLCQNYLSVPFDNRYKKPCHETNPESISCKPWWNDGNRSWTSPPNPVTNRDLPNGGKNLDSNGTKDDFQPPHNICNNGPNPGTDGYQTGKDDQCHSHPTCKQTGGSELYKILRVDDDQNCFNYFLKAVVCRRKLENYRKTLIVLASSMGRDPVRMRNGVIRSMFIHLQCFRVLGPLFLKIKNLLAPFWNQPRPLKYLASMALRNDVSHNSTRCPHDFPGRLESGIPALPKSLQKYLLFLEEEDAEMLERGRKVE